MAGFEEVKDTAEVVPHPSQAKGQQFAIQAIMLGLKALSQKFVIALSTCFTGLGLLGGWLLWNSVLPNPTTPQLIGLGEYAAFFLLLEFVRRR